MSIKRIPRFKILLCGKKELLVGHVKKMLDEADIHFQYTSSTGFLMSRAMFNSPHIVLIDADSNKGDISLVIREFCEQFPDIVVYPITTSIDHQNVVQVMSAGAKGYFLLPNDYRKLREQITLLVNEWRMVKQQKEFLELQQEAYDFSQIIGKSRRLVETLHRAKKVIQSNAMTVLLTGETGTGKELFARAIHYNSANRNCPFVDIACSALPETLLESELFGFEKGAFTDARERKIGLFELAGSGTIFLDEIGDITKATQSKLLKVLEGRVMRRLGGLRDIPVKARIIAATSVNLEEKMRSGEFRRDLYHRLKILPLEIPPLRERKDDIPLLVESFVQTFNEMYKKKVKGIIPEALELLRMHDWEGNVRELRHCIERAVLLEERDWLDQRDFDLPNSDGERYDGNETIVGETSNELTVNISFEEASLHTVQTMLVHKVLDRVGGNKRKAAHILKISRPRLDRILHSGNGVFEAEV